MPEICQRYSLDPFANIGGRVIQDSGDFDPDHPIGRPARPRNQVFILNNGFLDCLRDSVPPAVSRAKQKTANRTSYFCGSPFLFQEVFENIGQCLIDNCFQILFHLGQVLLLLELSIKFVPVCLHYLPRLIPIQIHCWIIVREVSVVVIA